MKIIAIDPGYERLGIAVIEKLPKEKEKLLYSDCFKTSAKKPFVERLTEIGLEIGRIIELFEPDSLAMETLFFQTNTSTAMKVAEARGVIIFAAASRKINVFEYNPNSVKVAITGYGKSDKTAIMSMIPKLISIEKDIKYDDEYDAIAIGLTCIASEKSLL